MQLNVYLFILLAIFSLTACNKGTYRDIRPEHWTWWGADMDTVNQVFATIKAANTGDEYWDDGRTFSAGHWTYEFTQLANNWEQQAEALVQQNPQQAAQAFYQASVYYGLAKYPAIFPTPAEQAAYDKQIETYAQSFLLKGYGFETVTTAVNGYTQIGFLHLPKTINDAVPLVLGNNGLDVFALESAPLVEDLLKRGIAVLVFDIAGTGTNRNLALTPEFERSHLAFLDTLANDKRIDTSRVAAFGISFAGNAMGKLAMTQPDRFKAIANICGPLHQVFTISPSQVSDIEPMYINGVIDRMQLTAIDPVSVVKAVRGFSLIEQGLLGQGQVTRVPVLSLNARNDYVAPKSDMELITTASQGGVIIWSGEDDHCPKNRQRDMPKVAEFLAKYL